MKKLVLIFGLLIVGSSFAADYIGIMRPQPLFPGSNNEPYQKVCGNVSGKCVGYIPTFEGRRHKLEAPNYPARSLFDTLLSFNLAGKKIFSGDIVRVKGRYRLINHRYYEFARIDSVEILSQQVRYTCESIDNHEFQFNLYFIRSGIDKNRFKTFLRMDEKGKSEMWLGAYMDLKGKSVKDHGTLKGTDKSYDLVSMNSYWRGQLGIYSYYPEPRPNWSVEIKLLSYNPIPGEEFMGEVKIHIHEPVYGKSVTENRRVLCKNPAEDYN